MLIALMSAPAINARSPAPVTMIARGPSVSSSRKSLPDLLYHLPVEGVQFFLTVDGQDGDFALTFYTYKVQDETPFPALSSQLSGASLLLLLIADHWRLIAN